MRQSRHQAGPGRQASALLAAAAVFSNVLGLARNLIFYRQVGEPAQLEVYFASFRVADLFFNLLIVGAITSAVVPVLTELVSTERKARAQEVTNELLSWATLFFLALIILLWL